MTPEAAPRPTDPAAQYVAAGRRPWSKGYAEYKHAFLLRALADETLRQAFASGSPLPDGFGPGLDERVVEYPWVLARLRPEGAILDAGSTFSTPLLLDHPRVAGRELVIYTRETDWMGLRPRVSYVFGDLRRTILQDALFSSACCISTLEHVGMAPSFAYSARRPWPEADPSSYRDVMREFHRMLVPGGQLLLTVPFGRREDHGWLQQFDEVSLAEVASTFDGPVVRQEFFRYDASGWQRATAAECADCRYWNFHDTPEPDADNAAAARAVACLEFAKPTE